VIAMQLTRLKITGFKSFADAVDIRIEPGLTGVVGPNGCGKSNLVEALRWVMGENSHKNMRASSMDDVIFAGTSRRSSRNHAEVMLTLDNTQRTAPAILNDADVLEVSRKISSGDGSTYRINGREVRARDVQVMFADAATGARSSALVRQGQISELIAAKPQARRAILEDAAGIAGLYTRRREAELRLKAADDNLIRVEDVLREMEQQSSRLQVQAEHAAHYRKLSADIRHHEMLIYALAWMKVRDQVAQCEQDVNTATLALGEVMTHQAQTAKDQAIAAHTLEPLRIDEQHKAEALQRIRTALQMLEGEERRAQERAKELAQRLTEGIQDEARQETAIHDASIMLARIEEELASFPPLTADFDPQLQEYERDCHQKEHTLAHSENQLAQLQAHIASVEAQRTALARQISQEQQRITHAAQELTNINQQMEELEGHISSLEPFTSAKLAYETAQQRLNETHAHAEHLRRMLVIQREEEQAARIPLLDAEKKVQRLEGELKTLQKLFAPRTRETWPRVLDEVEVEKGYEIALGAALGEDLEASIDASAPIHWVELDQNEPPPALPEGIASLASYTQAPPALLRALSHIAVVDPGQGERLQAKLKAGQSLVSRGGDVWRWDGLITRAEAPNRAARHLSEKNRLTDVEAAFVQMQQSLHGEKEAFAQRQQQLKDTIREEAVAVEAVRQHQKACDAARDAFSQREKNEAQRTSRHQALVETQKRLTASLAQMNEALIQTQSEYESCVFSGAKEQEMHAVRLQVAEQRLSVAQARATWQAYVQAHDERMRRQQALTLDKAQWQQRLTQAQSARETLRSRLHTLRTQQDELAQAPDTFFITRRTLLSDLQEAETARQEAANRLAHAQVALADLDHAAKAALNALSAARESKITSEVRLESARAKQADTTALITEQLDLSPHTLWERTQTHITAEKPSASQLENTLSRLKREREELGGVNLRADNELNEMNAKTSALIGERDDLIEAIRRLRGGIGNLNREGRERLLAAFDTVNAHFKTLFSLLFGGGSAELKLIESDDPLEAGLEIMAHPPGKKPQILTLLSGGEQTLTATALIFAVFLTNPSPVCVLDEVDAPLDDANVERYCDLLEDMVRRTETRFLVITHNPITMSRMNRLFGVTMAEQGVSMVVSVNLDQAQELAQAV
jgi:chromosome segregation protein